MPTTSTDKPEISESLERLALLQSLSSSSSNNAAAAAVSAFNLKTLLIKKEKQTTSDNQFKPINNNSKTDNTTSNYSTNNELVEEDEEDEDDLETQAQLKLQMSLATPHSSSSSCTSPINSNQPQQQQQHLNNYDPINTADIAQKVRDLLSVHNIGQRVFAKYILGLSQGTVSELLSKPKHWEKLTEKGRESYRKMYSWSCSEQSINKLKAISPRKGNKDNYFYHQNTSSSSSSTQINSTNNSSNLLTSNVKEDSATEERIAQILNEAQKQMKASGIKVGGLRQPNVSEIIFEICFLKNLTLYFFKGCLLITISIWFIIS